MTEIKEEISIIQMAQDIATIKQAVLGNGVRGLCQRVNDLECTEKKYVRLLGFASGIGIVVGYIVKNLGG